MTEEKDELDDIPAEQLAVDVQQRRKIRQRISEEIPRIEGKVYEVYSTLNEIILKLEKKQEQGKITELNSCRDKLTRMKLRLASKNLLSITDLKKMDEETAYIESHIKPFLPLIPVTDSQRSMNEQSLKQSSAQYESVLTNYRIFDKLTDDTQRRAYETLLSLRLLKIKILEKLSEGVCNVSEIAAQLGLEESMIQERLKNLVDFGNISADEYNLTEDSKHAISLYKIIKKEARKEPVYAALAMLLIITSKKGGSSTSAIEQYTHLERGMMEKGAQLLKKEGFINESPGRESYETIYFGDTPKAGELFKSLQYRRVKCK